MHLANFGSLKFGSFILLFGNSQSPEDIEPISNCGGQFYAFLLQDQWNTSAYVGLGGFLLVKTCISKPSAHTTCRGSAFSMG